MKGLSIRDQVTRLAAVVLLTATGAVASADDSFGPESINGTYILDLEGTFTTRTPFGPDPVQLEAAIIGQLEFDGSGLAWGESTLVFHDESVPVGVRARKRLIATYAVSIEGLLLVEVDEFAIDEQGNPAPARSNEFKLECLIVQRARAARCLFHSLVSYTQGPQPVALPATMSGGLQRQN